MSWKFYTDVIKRKDSGMRLNKNGQNILKSFKNFCLDPFTP